MTKELYPRPRARIGELVVFSHKEAKERVYHQMKVSGAHFTDKWIYVGLASVFDSKKGYVRYGVVADEDEIVENLTTGARLVDGEWKTIGDMAHEIHSEYVAKELEQDSVKMNLLNQINYPINNQHL